MDGQLVKRVLMVAYHFPPMGASSGIQRTLRFAQYLPELAWEPTVLTVHPRAYPVISDASWKEVPSNLDVRRVFALDTARHLSLLGRYPQLLAIPDRWWSWCLAAIPVGLALIRRIKPDVLWTTYPVATAHLIGYVLHRLTGIPWVADFRDPMAQDDYPIDPLEHRAYRWIESLALRHCARAVFTAPGALRLYADRYPGRAAGALALIENGYDEAAFSLAESLRSSVKDRRGPVVLLHSGTVYASERDPRPFFAALARLRHAGIVTGQDVRIVMRASGCDGYLRDLIAEYALSSMVYLRPALPYVEALAEMLDVDGLLLLQAANCNHQVPAKLYEYLRAKRPILALTDPAGDTARVLREAGVDTIAPLDCEAEIEALLQRFLVLLRERRAPVGSASAVAGASRRSRTAELAGVLDAAAA